MIKIFFYFNCTKYYKKSRFAGDWLPPYVRCFSKSIIVTEFFVADYFEFWRIIGLNWILPMNWHNKIIMTLQTSDNDIFNKCGYMKHYVANANSWGRVKLASHIFNFELLFSIIRELVKIIKTWFLTSWHKCWIILNSI